MTAVLSKIELQFMTELSRSYYTKGKIIIINNIKIMTLSSYCIYREEITES